MVVDDRNKDIAVVDMAAVDMAIPTITTRITIKAIIKATIKTTIKTTANNIQVHLIHLGKVAEQRVGLES